MLFDISIAMTWILFLALFPIAFYWFRRAYRILMKRDFSEVALKRGEPPPNPEKFAPYTFLNNALCGVAVLVAIVGVLIGHFEYQSWSTLAGMTIWTKFLLDFAISRHAHAGNLGKKNSANNS